MKKNITFELLAPAGNWEKMKTAFLYGADAVYFGLPDFSLRVRINDFTLTQIAKAIKYAHSLKKKAYVTVNIFGHNHHLKKLPSYLRFLAKQQVDALIVSDPGIISLAKKHCPKTPIHLSTQANCTNKEALFFWYKQGVERIVLGREVTLKEIQEMHQAYPKIELEYFIHGAMCMSYSGRCFLSKYFLDRSANQGDCVQPCRWEYDVFIKAKGHEELLELVSEQHGSYLLNSKDLCLLSELPALMKAGVSSYKIEGRAKSVYYLATVVGIYRQAFNVLEDKKMKAEEKKKILAQLLNDLKDKLVHRGYTPGFLLGREKMLATEGQNNFLSHNSSAWEFCGQVEKVVIKNKIQSLEIKVHNTIRLGDVLELIIPPYQVLNIKVKEMMIPNKQEKVVEAHGGGGGQRIVIDIPSTNIVPEGSVLRRQL
ncbi:MAG: U32 family peptidase C-terminal domain-containing protein [Planctomycetes bacterium]|nr:U32 family peptidase C-terminal domain-containing protein [Planctomycetota bacterium]